MEDDRNEIRSKWKTTKMNEDQNGGRLEWKTTKMENKSKQKMTKMEADQNGSKEELSWVFSKDKGASYIRFARFLLKMQKLFYTNEVLQSQI